jgi:hypothetical protein
MGDLVPVVCFLSMLMVPCCLAMRTVRGETNSRGRSSGVVPMAEGFDEGEHYVAPAQLTVDRQALAIQRNREIYFRTGGAMPSHEHGAVTSSDRASNPTYLGQM